jgi:hypothetical protein
LNRNAADGKRQSESLKICADNCRPSEGRENRRRSSRSRVGVSATPMPQTLRRAYRGRGGVGY